MYPHWGLWRRIFFVKKHTVTRQSLATGGFGIQTRNDVMYFDLKLNESVQGWRKRWFYLTVDAESRVPEFSLQARVKSRRSWKHELSSSEKAEADQLLSQVATFRCAPGKELTGIQLISTFLKRRIQPLQARAHAMWMYSGLQDPTRTSPEELTSEDLESRVRQVTNLKRDDPFIEPTAATPFGDGCSLPEVTQPSSFIIPLLVRYLHLT